MAKRKAVVHQRTVGPHFPLGLLLLTAASFGLMGWGGWHTFQAYQDRIYPAIEIDGVLIGGLTVPQARERLIINQTSYPLPDITLAANSTQVASSAAELGLRRNFDPALEQAWQVGRQGSIWQRLSELSGLLVKRTTFSSKLEYDDAALLTFIQALADQINVPGKNPAVKLATSGNPNTLSIEPGKIGTQIDELATLDQLHATLATTETVVNATLTTTNAELSEADQAAALERAKRIVGKTIRMTSPTENVKVNLNDQAILESMKLPHGWSEAELHKKIVAWASQLNRPPQNAVFEYDAATNKVSRFEPHRNGLALDENATYQQLLSVLTELEQNTPTSPQEHTAELSMKVAEPEITLAKTNNLGIKELVGFGDSEYAHSIPSRVHNVSLASQRINNFLIKPGEEFSFNQALGEVSSRTGYKPGYIIQSGRTVLGDGGGVCQVSTTVFRAALDAGFPITKRKAHSFRVSYYELDRKPGVDATVFSGEVDLRFVNDTQHAVLIHTQTDDEKLYMKVEFYGTSDGRTTEMTDHKTWDYRAPPAPLYIPDPTLPKGVTKRADWPVAGIKASFKNTVKDKDGKIIREDEFYSNYIPWSAKFLVGV